MLKIQKENGVLSIKRQEGVYKTPYKTAFHMVKLIAPYITGTNKILDPAVGDGVFIQVLLDFGVNPSVLYAHDLAEEKIVPLKGLGINADCMDTLLDEYPKMDIIIGNPPYKSRRKSLYMKKNRLKLEKKYSFIGLYNLYSLFVVNAIQHLKCGGILCFIVEDAFFTNRYYQRFREFILNSTYILEMKLAPWRLFHKTKADVRTAIITLKKRKLTDSNNTGEDKKHKMRLIDRLANEEEYNRPPKIQNVPQIEYRRMPDQKFFVGVPMAIIRMVQDPPMRFGDIAQGGTGISTGNDYKYLRRAQEVELNSKTWVGFYKSGQRSPYYYKTPYFIERNYQKNAEADPKNFLVRNEQFYFKEGITCSSIGRKFSAAYMPPGNLFGVNANFFFDNKEDLFYSLGFLNSKLVQYLARKVINRSNIIATSFIKEIPFIKPSIEQKRKVVAIVKNIVTTLLNNPKYNYNPESEKIDEIIFELYGISDKIKKEIADFCTNIMDLV
ncbi:MAG: Eco57I restriction-modification methylase domain-containing protein [Candidatus Thorarchaeota archaeon]